jgi:hypothetical protein
MPTINPEINGAENKKSFRHYFSIEMSSEG